MARLATTALLVALASGCSTFHEVTNEGTTCLLADEPDGPGSSRLEPQTFAADAPLHVFYKFCLDSCDSNGEASCTASVEAGRITIESHASFTRKDHNGCLSYCAVLAATCSTPPLAAGTYEVVYGWRTSSLTIPSETSASPCLDERY